MKQIPCLTELLCWENAALTFLITNAIKWIRQPRNCSLMCWQQKKVASGRSIVCDPSLALGTGRVELTLFAHLCLGRCCELWWNPEVHQTGAEQNVWWLVTGVPTICFLRRIWGAGLKLGWTVEGRPPTCQLEKYTKKADGFLELCKHKRKYGIYQHILCILVLVLKQKLSLSHFFYRRLRGGK